jgi:ABC-2 type transport system permease protein
VLTRIQALVEKRRILWTLVERDLRVRYAGSLLGYVWTILDPLLLASVYFVVFTTIFQAQRVADTPYFLFLLSGLLAWQWFNGAMNDTARALLQEARLVRSTNLPREMWIIRVVLAKGIEFLLSLPVLAAFTIFYVVRGDAHVGWELLAFPLGVVMQTMLLIGLGLILAPATVLATDTQRVVRIFLRLFFYITPILYGIDRVPEQLRTFLVLNPLNGILELYRGGLFERSINWSDVAVSAVIILVTFVVGWTWFRRVERSVLKEI